MAKTRIIIVSLFVIAAILYTVGFAFVPILKLDKVIPVPINTGAGAPTNSENLAISTKSKFYIDKVEIEVVNGATGQKIKTTEKYSKLGNDKAFVAMLYTSVGALVALGLGILLMFLNLKVFAKMALIVGILGMVAITIMLTLFTTDNAIVNVMVDILSVVGLGVKEKLQIDSGFILIATGTCLATLNYFAYTFM